MPAAAIYNASSHALLQLTDERLLSRLDELAARERRLTLCIVDHLAEVERRDLFAREGYDSMFAYCIGRLGYSASAAMRRIRAARCVTRFPRVRAMLVDKRVNLSTVSMVAGILNEENHVTVLERIAGRSQREVEAIVAEYRPRGAVHDSVKAVSVQAGDTQAAVATNPTLGCETNRSGCSDDPSALPTDRPDGQGAGTTTVNDSGAGVPTSAVVGNEEASSPDAAQRQFVVRFGAGPQFMKQIEAARALLSFRLPANASLADVFGAVLGEFIERHDPAHRAARRAARKTDRRKAQAPESAEKVDGSGKSDAGTRNGATRPEKSSSMRNPRAIPAAVRDDVLAASLGRCEYISPSGRRCGATRYLQVDHIVPVALGGTPSRENLRVLCARHNRTEAARMLKACRQGEARGGGHRPAPAG